MKVSEVEVTPEMVNAGMDALQEYNLGDDWRYVLKSVYSAMVHEKLRGSKGIESTDTESYQ